MASRRTFLLSMTVAGSGMALQSRAAKPSGVSTEFQPAPIGAVKLLPGPFSERAKLNRDYVAGLKNQNLLQNFYLEAGLWSPNFRMTSMGGHSRGDDIHWGWESPTCQLRGHFLGHWLSAAAYIAASTGDAEVRGKADQ